jgi:hypothetical protein
VGWQRRTTAFAAAAISRDRRRAAPGRKFTRMG